MKILIIGGGGREHALAWKIAQSPQAQRIFVAPGNPGTAREPKVENIALHAEDIAGLRDFAQKQKIDLTIVGPEAPLVAGIVDEFHAAGLNCFGPTAAAARIEGSKSYAKAFLARNAIPSAAYETFNAAEPALAYLKTQALPIVIKADGLAAGKGVVVAHTAAEAAHAVKNILTDKVFGEAGAQIVIEEYLAGTEVSFIGLCDGAHFLPFASAQDHKARDDGDHGPNTGGMGAYSPAPIVTQELKERILTEIIYPTIHGLAAENTPYVGFLYAGLMISPEGAPRVLEYNCRCGDPETQPILLRLRTDLLELISAANTNNLHKTQIDWDPRPALGVVMAAAGYPGAYRKGDPITGLDLPLPENTKIFHAGTAIHNEQIITHGGRVLSACALGESLAEAQRNAYALVAQIQWDGQFFRRDIGHRALS